MVNEAAPEVALQEAEEVAAFADVAMGEAAAGLLVADQALEVVDVVHKHLNSRSTVPDQLSYPLVWTQPTTNSSDLSSHSKSTRAVHCVPVTAHSALR